MSSCCWWLVVGQQLESEGVLSLNNVLAPIGPCLQVFCFQSGAQHTQPAATATDAATAPEAGAAAAAAGSSSIVGGGQATGPGSSDAPGQQVCVVGFGWIFNRASCLGPWLRYHVGCHPVALHHDAQSHQHTQQSICWFTCAGV